MHNSGSAPRHPYKVVIGRDIQYKAKPSVGSSWTWRLGSGSGSGFLPHAPYTLIDANSASGIAGLPLSASPTSNGDLGPAFGVLDVRNGLVDGQGNPQYAQEQVEIFFEKDIPAYHDQTVPNWFYYWKQLFSMFKDMPVYNFDDPSNPLTQSIPVNIEYSNIGDFAWNPSASSFKLGASIVTPTQLVPLDFGDPSCPRYAASYDIKIILGEGTSKICAHQYEVVQDPYGNILQINVLSGTGYTGISCFNQVFRHEWEHLNITSENYMYGFRTDWDTDGDGYLDAFEIANAAYGFNFMQPTPYSLGPGTVGYDYEESRCRAVENATNPLDLADDDWSFDPTNVYQGKNWKN